jgi:hypothetical protein
MTVFFQGNVPWIQCWCAESFCEYILARSLIPVRALSHRPLWFRTDIPMIAKPVFAFCIHRFHVLEMIALHDVAVLVFRVRIARVISLAASAPERFITKSAL